jgi:hypothetical protein
MEEGGLLMGLYVAEKEEQRYKGVFGGLELMREREGGGVEVVGS